MTFIKQKFGISEGTRFLDLGAGTGKFTQYFVESGAEITAVEPVPGMLKSLLEQYPSIQGVEGTAENIPVGDNSIDVVASAQAYHWFDADKAAKEALSLLKPNDFLVMVWNNRDESYPWVRTLTEIMDPYSGDTPRSRNGNWRKPFDSGELFTKLKSKEFVHSHIGDSKMVLNRVLSTSFILKLPDSEENKVIAQVNDLVAKTPELQSPMVEFPYLTEVFWCQKK
jgi:SAM-dependent methyltransferase